MGFKANRWGAVSALGSIFVCLFILSACGRFNQDGLNGYWVLNGVQMRDLRNGGNDAQMRKIEQGGYVLGIQGQQIHVASQGYSRQYMHLPPSKTRYSLQNDRIVLDGCNYDRLAEDGVAEDCYPMRIESLNQDEMILSQTGYSQEAGSYEVRHRYQRVAPEAMRQLFISRREQVPSDLESYGYGQNGDGRRQDYPGDGMGAPGMNGPGMGGPNMGGPNSGGPNMGGPNMGGQGMNSPLGPPGSFGLDPRRSDRNIPAPSRYGQPSGRPQVSPQQQMHAPDPRLVDPQSQQGQPAQPGFNGQYGNQSGINPALQGAPGQGGQGFPPAQQYRSNGQGPGAGDNFPVPPPPTDSQQQGFQGQTSPPQGQGGFQGNRQQ